MGHDSQPSCPKARQKVLAQLSNKQIAPPKVFGDISAADLMDSAFLSYNGGRLREAGQLLATRMTSEETTLGLSLSGALTPAGLGMSCLVPLIEAGFIAEAERGVAAHHVVAMHAGAQVI